MNNSDMPANPIRGADNTIFNLRDNHIDSNYLEQGKFAIGLTKREAFAMAVMQNVMLNYNPWEQGDFDSSDYESAATQAVGLADALLKELDKQE